ncbi:MAG: hypothetical protein J7574_17585 [Flavobacterium sp.]|nr:hypothetical protein [Flavobacterium sp.]
MKYIIEIIVVIFIVAFGIQYFLDNGLRNLKNTQINDWKNILDGKINSDIIINGSSRGFVGYNSNIIGEKLKSSCFNLSFNAGGYNLQQDKFDIYIKKNKIPKVVIQNIDLAYFIKNNAIPEEWQFYPFLYNKDLESLTSKFDTKFNYFKIFPLLKYNQNFGLIKEGMMANFSNQVKKNAKTLNGFCPQNRAFKVDDHNLKRFQNQEVKSNNEKEIKLLHQMIAFYRSRLKFDSKIILVWMPEHKLRLTENYNQQRKFIVNELNLLQKKDKNILFIDMAYDDISNFDDNYYDTFHLTEKGANEFSKKIAVRINNFLN